MEIRTDFLVIGSGLAGLFFAIRAADIGTVAVVTKKDKIESSTNYAQGGIAAVMAEDDCFDSHVADTLTSGVGLCNEDIVNLVVKEGPERIDDLIDWGVSFSKKSDAPERGFDLGREGGHSHRRVLHAKDYTGREIERVLSERAEQHPNIAIYENHFAVNLITRSKLTGERRSANLCLGAYVLDIEGRAIHTFRAPYVVLASGGSGKTYLYTSNPDIATGDGLAMAYRAGAAIANMEFFQFHPTCLYHPAAKSFLVSEAVRGEGGELKLRNGSAFMEKYHPLKSLAPRDVVARAIDTEMKRNGDDFVLLDITHKDRDFLSKRFPTIYERCLSLGIDMACEPIPVVPAAHYQCGGVLVDDYARTTIEGLFACGEVACTGLHGANRLASNSLLEAVVFANRAFLKVSEMLPGKTEESFSIPPWDPKGATESDESIVVSHNWDEIRRCMWNYVGIVRSDKRLARAKRRIDLIKQEIDEYYWNFTITPDLLELRNIADVAQLIVACAIMRKESRGLHNTIDYPTKDDANWRRNTIIQQYP
ncbi:MAG: L-aspartate oxidase [Deltaproteobacteria bacterium]|nr:L-aspartate oxidase [Deltaproteobacteria bacterium]